jgi:hypothetical protein
MKRLFDGLTRPAMALVLLLGGTSFLACDTFRPEWFAFEDHVALYSLARAEFIGREAAYDFISQRPVVVEGPKMQDPFDFDMAVTEIDGAFYALPAGLFEGFPIRPGIAVDSSGIEFADMTQAPRDGYVTDELILLRHGWVYAVRTRLDFRGCHMYGKFEVVALDDSGIAQIRAMRNPQCNDRNLVPPRS